MFTIMTSKIQKYHDLKIHYNNIQGKINEKELVL